LYDYLRVTPEYGLSAAAGKIRCPTLVTQAEGDPLAKDASKLYDALTCPKTLVRFTNAEGAVDHYEGMARSLFHQRAFDWLDKVFNRAT
jgi:hypothetical protein